MFRSGFGVLGALALAVALSGTGIAQDKAAGPLDVAVFAELPAIETPEVSPNGKLLAAKVAIGGKQYFAIKPLEGGQPRLIPAGEAEFNWWHWVNDDYLVVGIGQRQKMGDGKDAPERYVRRAVSVRASDGKMTKIGLQLIDDADNVFWVARDGSPRVLMLSQRTIYYNEAGFWPDVDEIDVATGQRRNLVRGRGGVLKWAADAKGVVRMGVGYSEDGRNMRLLYRADANSDFRVVDRAQTHQEVLRAPAMFLQDPGKGLIIADDADGYSALYDLDLTTLERGKQHFATKGFDIGGLVSNAAGDDYLGVYVEQDKPGVQWTDPDMAALHKNLAGKIKGGVPHIASMSRDRSVVIVYFGSADAPGAFFLYNAKDDSFALLQMANSTIQLKRMHPVRTIRYKARDGLEIAGVLTLPKGKSANLPLIVMPHGGPFARDDESWDWEAQFLADRGYAVIQPNYRGSSGYGTAFTEKGEGQWGLAMQDDLNDAVTELAKLGIADAKRVCMVGASYGGYAALRAAQRDSKLYRCAVSVAGVSDLNRLIGHDRNFLGSGTRRDWLRAQAPDLKGVSPIHGAESVSIPVLLVHGEKDHVVPIIHSRAMADRLKDARKDVTFIEQPEADHSLSRSEDRLEYLKALEAFLAKHNPA